jgi:hypothetical protein
MCYSLSPEVKHIDRHTAIVEMSEVATRVKASLEVEVRGQYFSLTCDHWTSIAGISYLAATIHYIDENWNLISFTLSCKEHTGSRRLFTGS